MRCCFSFVPNWSAVFGTIACTTEEESHIAITSLHSPHSVLSALFTASPARSWYLQAIQSKVDDSCSGFVAAFWFVQHRDNIFFLCGFDFLSAPRVRCFITNRGASEPAGCAKDSGAEREEETEKQNGNRAEAAEGDNSDQSAPRERRVLPPAAITVPDSSVPASHFPHGQTVNSWSGGREERRDRARVWRGREHELNRNGRE